MSQLSIIIPTFNEEKWVERTLLTVKECAPDAEILVVDGGSSEYRFVPYRSYCSLQQVVFIFKACFKGTRQFGLAQHENYQAGLALFEPCLRREATPRYLKTRKYYGREHHSTRDGPS
jgi:hypothetical protein